MRPIRRIFLRWLLLLLATASLSQIALAQKTWQLTVGSQRPDCTWVEGSLSTALCSAFQGMAFEPNEIWIHAGDSITWTHRTDEGHTVTLLQPGQVRPSNAVGCTSVTGSATSPSNSAYDPSGPAAEQCVNSGTIGGNGDTYTVQFPTAGNYKFTCLIHAGMYGAVHVLDAAAALPHDQTFYNNQQKIESNSIYYNAEPLKSALLLGPNEVAASGVLVSSGGGWGYESVFRFLAPIITVHVGDTVQWINFDPVEPHTITFGCPTDDAGCPAGGGPGAHVNTTGSIAVAADGVWAASMDKALDPNTDGINSGLIGASRQDAGGQVQAGPASNKFRLKFNFPGTYRYICELHDELGMVGYVIVTPKGGK